MTKSADTIVKNMHFICKGQPVYKIACLPTYGITFVKLDYLSQKLSKDLNCYVDNGNKQNILRSVHKVRLYL